MENNIKRMTELKNTPWEADCLQEGADWIVIDSKGNIITLGLNREAAHSIAALPDTLAELEALKAENERLRKPRKVFVVVYLDKYYYGERYVEAIFLNESDAEEYVSKNAGTEIDEHELSTPKE